MSLVFQDFLLEPLRVEIHSFGIEFLYRWNRVEMQEYYNVVTQTLHTQLIAMTITCTFCYLVNDRNNSIQRAIIEMFAVNIT